MVLCTASTALPLPRRAHSAEYGAIRRNRRVNLRGLGKLRDTRSSRGGKLWFRLAKDEIIIEMLLANGHSYASPGAETHQKGNAMTHFDARSVRENYQRDGFYIVPDLFTSRECEAWKREALRLSQAVSSTVIISAAAKSAAFRALSDDGRLVAVLRALMPDGIEFWSDKTVYKSARQAFATPWHCDESYWRGARPKISVWIALDEANESNGALKVLPGSHKRNWVHHSGDMAATNNEFENVITPDWDAAQEVICVLPQGGAIFFSDRLLHASCPNRAGTDRYSLISTYHAPGEEAIDRNFPARHVIEYAPATEAA